MSHPNEDPIVTSSRREAVAASFVWLAALVYSVGYCYRYGYDRKLDPSLSDMRFYFGWPDWVFFGIVVPWLVCTAVSAVFAFAIIRDAPLGDDRDEPEGRDDGDAP